MHKNTDMLKVTSMFLLLLLNVCQKCNPRNCWKQSHFDLYDPFWSMFAKFQNAIISSVMYVHLTTQNKFTPN